MGLLKLISSLIGMSPTRKPKRKNAPARQPRGCGIELLEERRMMSSVYLDFGTGPVPGAFATLLNKEYLLAATTPITTTQASNVANYIVAELNRVYAGHSLTFVSSLGAAPPAGTVYQERISFLLPSKTGFGRPAFDVDNGNQKDAATLGAWTDIDTINIEKVVATAGSLQYVANMKKSLAQVAVYELGHDLGLVDGPSSPFAPTMFSDITPDGVFDAMSPNNAFAFSERIYITHKGIFGWTWFDQTVPLGINHGGRFFSRTSYSLSPLEHLMLEADSGIGFRSPAYTLADSAASLTSGGTLTNSGQKIGPSLSPFATTAPFTPAFSPALPVPIAPQLAGYEGVAIRNILTAPTGPFVPPTRLHTYSMLVKPGDHITLQIVSNADANLTGTGGWPKPAVASLSLFAKSVSSFVTGSVVVPPAATTDPAIFDYVVPAGTIYLTIEVNEVTPTTAPRGSADLYVVRYRKPVDIVNMGTLPFDGAWQLVYKIKDGAVPFPTSGTFDVGVWKSSDGTTKGVQLGTITVTPEVGAGGIGVVRLSKDGTDFQPDANGVLIIEIDPNGVIPETRKDNNTSTTKGVAVDTDGKINVYGNSSTDLIAIDSYGGYATDPPTGYFVEIAPTSPNADNPVDHYYIEPGATGTLVEHWQDTDANRAHQSPGYEGDGREHWTVSGVTSLADIIVNGYAGGDTVINNTGLNLLVQDKVAPVDVYGGTGTNTLDGDGGNSTFVGGNPTNTGDGGDEVYVTDGNHNITTTGSNNAVAVGSGNNTFQMVGNNVFHINGAAFGSSSETEDFSFGANSFAYITAPDGTTLSLSANSSGGLLQLLVDSDGHLSISSFPVGLTINYVDLPSSGEFVLDPSYGVVAVFSPDGSLWNVSASENPATLTFSADASGNTVLTKTGVGTLNVNTGTTIVAPVTFVNLSGNTILNVDLGTPTSVVGGLFVDAVTPVSLDVQAGTVTCNVSQEFNSVNIGTTANTAGDAKVVMTDTPATIAANGAHELFARSLTIAHSATGTAYAYGTMYEYYGTLDLRNNDLIVPYASGAATNDYNRIMDMVRSGANLGSPTNEWRGKGITSTAIVDATLHALGVYDNAVLNGFGTGAVGSAGLYHGASISGRAAIVMQANMILVKFTYGGDTNADGTINVDDYQPIDINNGSDATGYHNGDTNYDGNVNVDDYQPIDVNIGNPIANSGIPPRWRHGVNAVSLA